MVGFRGGPDGAVWRRGRCGFVDGMLDLEPGVKLYHPCLVHQSHKMKRTGRTGLGEKMRPIRDVFDCRG